LQLAVEASKTFFFKDPYWRIEYELLRGEAESLLTPAQAKPDDSSAGDGNK